MQKSVVILLSFLLSYPLSAQKIKAEYEEGSIRVNDKEVATMTKTKDKENLGLTSTFDVFSLSGDKLIIGAYAGEFEQDPNDDMNQFYRVSFLTVNLTGIFAVSKLGAEKSFGKLMAKSGIFTDTGVDEQLVKEFIARYGKTPKVAIDYSVVGRDKSWPLKLNADKTIEQQSKIIGNFKDISTINGQGIDTYEFYLPSGVKIATVNFTGGNNAQNCDMRTLKDNSVRNVAIATKETITASMSSIDRNQWVLERITKWLVANGYL
jgi:hypothetical protein